MNSSERNLLFAGPVLLWNFSLVGNQSLIKLCIKILVINAKGTEEHFVLQTCSGVDEQFLPLLGKRGRN